MGGYGSTRWGWHSKKTQVEDILKLPTRAVKEYFRRPGERRRLTWSSNGRELASIDFEIIGQADTPKAIRLIYIHGARSGQPVDYDYQIRLTATRLYRGGLRYWFLCPKCGYRAGCLYSGGGVYSCRHCLQLAYASQQDYSGRRMFAQLAESMRDSYPGITPGDLRRLLG